MHKTGSTSIQHFFSRRRWILPYFGIFYPDSTGPDGRRQPKHNAIFTAVSHEADFGAPHPALGPSADLIEALADQIERRRASTCVLSAEGFSGEKPEFADAFAPLADRFDISVVVFLRRPDIWLEKFHRQMIMGRDTRERRGIEAFANAADTRRHLDYFGVLDWWARAFGADALKIAPYDENVDAMPRFLDAASLPRRIYQSALMRSRKNPSPSPDVVLATLRENRDGEAVGEGDIRLAPQAKLELVSRLEMAWRRRLSPEFDGVAPPPFIFSMLADARREIE